MIAFGSSPTLTLSTISSVFKSKMVTDVSDATLLDSPCEKSSRMPHARDACLSLSARRGWRPTFLYSSLVQTPRPFCPRSSKRREQNQRRLVEVHRDDRRLSLGTAASSGGSEGAEVHPDTPRDPCDHRVACTRHLSDGSLNDAG